MTWCGLMIFKLKTYFGINDSSEELQEAKTRIPTLFGIKIEIENEIVEVCNGSSGQSCLF